MSGSHTWYRVSPSNMDVHTPEPATFPENDDTIRQLVAQTQYRYFRSLDEAWQWMDDRISKRYEAAKEIYDKALVQVEKLKKARGG